MQQDAQKQADFVVEMLTKSAYIILFYIINKNYILQLIIIQK